MEPELETQSEQNRPRKFLLPLMNGQAVMAVATLVISLALAYATFVQADAARKSQISQTWPYVSYGTDNSSPEVKNEISFSLSNDGVGPARLDEIEFLYDGKPVSSPLEFLSACCATEAKAVSKNLTFTTDRVDGVLRSGEQRRFIRLPKTEQNAPLWDRLNNERWKVVVRTCYCSIFDDCWVFDSRNKRPDAVKACPANWTKFEERPNLRPDALRTAKTKE
jgi:hypothetical protein